MLLGQSSVTQTFPKLRKILCFLDALVILHRSLQLDDIRSFFTPKKIEIKLLSFFMLTEITLLNALSL